MQRFILASFFSFAPCTQMYAVLLAVPLCQLKALVTLIFYTVKHVGCSHYHMSPRRNYICQIHLQALQWHYDSALLLEHLVIKLYSLNGNLYQNNPVCHRSLLSEWAVKMELHLTEQDVTLHIFHSLLLLFLLHPSSKYAHLPTNGSQLKTQTFLEMLLQGNPNSM